MDTTGTYYELSEKYGLERETIGGGAQMLSRYMDAGEGITLTCEDGGGLPTSDNWHICVHPAKWDGDPGTLLLEMRSDDANAPSFENAINAALWAAEYGSPEIGNLVAKFGEWCDEQGLPKMSADELLLEDITFAQRDYLQGFLVLWGIADA